MAVWLLFSAKRKIKKLSFCETHLIDSFVLQEG